MYKHKIITDYIIKCIDNNELKVGDKIPTEKELTEKFNVSRITVHNAIKDLAKLGVVNRIKGKGSYIAKDMKIHDSFFEIKDKLVAKNQSYGETHEFLKLNIIKPFDSIKARLSLENNDRIFEAIRVMSQNDIVYGIDYSYISCDLMEENYFKSEDFVNNSFHNFLKNKTDVSFSKISIDIMIHFSDNYESKILNVKKNSPLICWVTNILDENNEIIACTYSIFNKEVSLISFDV